MIALLRRVALLVFVCSSLVAMTPAQEVDWEGVWAADSDYGPTVRGAVTLSKTGEHWWATVQGEASRVERVALKGGSIRWSFTFLDAGRFDGWQSKDGALIVGHWYQSPGVVETYFAASPLRLLPIGDGYRGDIRPLNNRADLYIPFIRDDEEGYRTFLRNPQRNLGVYFRIERMVPDGDELRLLNRDGETIATAKVVEPGERFTMLLPRFGETFDFTRRDRNGAPDYYGRRSSLLSPLLKPVSTGDGWPTATFADVGINPAKLQTLVQRIASSEPENLRSPYIHSLLIARGGKLVLEEYFHGHDSETPHDSRSAGKSVTSALLGVALQRGEIESVDLPIYPLFGGVDKFANVDPVKKGVTLRHLISMSSGFHCDDNDYETPGNEDRMQSQEEQPDWYRFALDLPMQNKPGEKAIYCSAGINLVGGAVTKATGQPLTRFFEEQFAAPLQIDHYVMNLMPDQRGYGGGGIRLRPRDFLKLGQLYLDGGVWNGKRLIPASWVRDSFAAQGSINGPDDYGFGWWRHRYNLEGREIDAFYASGNGGQLLFVVPDLELVVLFNAGNYSDYRTWSQFRDVLMTEEILPAVASE